MKVIELETAKLAKQKNFVEECQKAYIKRNMLIENGMN